MKRVWTAISLTLLVAIIAVGKSEYQSSVVKSKCNPQKIGLPEDAPLKLVAMFDFECAETFPNVPRSERAKFALELGYPSLLFGQLPEDEVLQLLDDVSHWGDMSFFISDPKILYEINARSNDAKVSKFIDFIHAVKSPETEFLSSNVNEKFLMALPLWNNPENMHRLDEWCSKNTCSETKTDCNIDLSLSDKLSVARKEFSLEEAYAICPLSFDWILSLRRSGLVDTNCSATFQVNNIMNNEKKMDEPCFTQNFSFSKNTSINPLIATLFLRYRQKHGVLFKMSQENIKKIGDYYPDISDFILRNKEK